MSVVKLRDETWLLRELSGDTVRLIPFTQAVPAIKRLIGIHDILSLNLDIAQRFKSLDDIVAVDRASLQDLTTLRRELVVYHTIDFHPPSSLLHYAGKLATLLTLLKRELVLG